MYFDDRIMCNATFLNVPSATTKPFDFSILVFMGITVNCCCCLGFSLESVPRLEFRENEGPIC